MCIHTGSACIYTYTHAYIHTYIHTYIPTNKHACIHTCLYTYIHPHRRQWSPLTRGQQGSGDLAKTLTNLTSLTASSFTAAATNVTTQACVCACVCVCVCMYVLGAFTGMCARRNNSERHTLKTQRDSERLPIKAHLRRYYGSITALIRLYQSLPESTLLRRY